MNLGLSGRVALVAGASRGLGRAVAQALAAEGAHLSLCARGADSLEETARSIGRQHGVEVISRALDVTREAEVGALIDQTQERFGRLDILVANAGGPPPGGFQEIDAAQMRSGLELNLLSTLILCRAAVPLMKRQRWGRIVAITSVSVKQPIDRLILSNVSRLGVLGLAKTMAAELASDGILVNVVCPGFTRTERLVELAARTAEREGVSDAEVIERWTREIPLGRLGEPEELASLVAFLCSERASYVTGTCLQVDGGFVRGVF